MGWAATANRRRRANVLALVPDVAPAPAAAPAPTESKHIPALRAAVLTITSLARFEEMVLLAGDPVKFRALVEPMLRADLPCCVHAWNAPHEKRCPTVLSRPKSLIVTPEQDLASRFVSTRNANVLTTDEGPRLVGPDGKGLW